MQEKNCQNKYVAWLQPTWLESVNSPEMFIIQSQRLRLMKDKQAVREAAQYAPAPVRRSPAPAHTCLRPAAPSAPCGMNIHDRHAAARSGGSVECGVVHINYVVTWTANQSGLVTLTFDLTLKVMSESRVTWATSANFSLPRPLYSRLRPDVHGRQTRRQTA